MLHLVYHLIMAEEQRPATIKTANEELELWIRTLKAGSVSAMAMNDYIQEMRASTSIGISRRDNNAESMQQDITRQALITDRVNDRMASLPGYGQARSHAIRLTRAASTQLPTEHKDHRDVLSAQYIFFTSYADLLHVHFSRESNPQSPQNTH